MIRWNMMRRAQTILLFRIMRSLCNQVDLTSAASANSHRIKKENINTGSAIRTFSDLGDGFDLLLYRIMKNILQNVWTVSSQEIAFIKMVVISGFTCARIADFNQKEAMIIKERLCVVIVIVMSAKSCREILPAIMM